MWKNRNLRSLIDVKRIVCRLEGGAKAENLKHICRALEITPKTKNWNLAAIEVVLKQKRFRQYGTFRPTSQNMTLSYDRFYESIRLRELPQFPGEYASSLRNSSSLLTTPPTRTAGGVAHPPSVARDLNLNFQ